MSLGFIGLGVMGTPMALNLARSGPGLTVWNRTAAKCRLLADAGASVVATVAEVFDRADVVILMLANEAAIDDVLQQAGSGHLRGRTIVNMGTISPEFSLSLQRDVTEAGGRYVEAPVSGSRGPAEAGQLIGMLAGAEDDVQRVKPTVARMCAKTFDCGEVPRALQTKLAVNLFLIGTVTGLAEAVHFAESMGIDRGVLRQVIDEGPMSSAVSRAKLAKLVERDFSVQASIGDVAMNARLITGAARRARVASPVIDLCEALFGATETLGFGGQDMAAVIAAVEARTLAVRGGE